MYEAIIKAHTQFRRAVKSGDKERIKRLHIAARDTAIPVSDGTIRSYERLSKHFIDGAKLDVARISPVLRLVEKGSEWEQLFRIARHTWSIPYSQGYGRRLRFVVFDEFHQAVIGIIGLQSPPADLRCRDELFTFPTGKKLEFINRTMDAYTIGAVPPYSHVLGGKLVAGLVAATEIRQAYWRLYAGKKTVLRRKRLDEQLVAITTTSAFGRSSIYNRLKCSDRLLAERIGVTGGHGTIHLESLYPEVLRLLERYDPDFQRSGYGHGPKLRWQNFKKAFDLCGVPRECFVHGLGREVYLYRLVDDLEKGMSGKGFGRARDLSTEEYSTYWLQRWAVPRANRDASYQQFVAKNYFPKLICP